MKSARMSFTHEYCWLMLTMSYECDFYFINRGNLSVNKFTVKVRRRQRLRPAIGADHPE